MHVWMQKIHLHGSQPPTETTFREQLHGNLEIPKGIHEQHVGHTYKTAKQTIRKSATVPSSTWGVAMNAMNGYPFLVIFCLLSSF